jgi:molybdopterin molybdotransferase
MVGATVVDRPVVAAELAEDVEKSPGKTHFVRARVWREGARWRAAPTGSQDSGVLTSMVNADGLLVLGQETGRVQAGQTVDVRLLQGEGVA